MDVQELIKEAKLGNDEAREKIVVKSKAFIYKVVKDTLPVFSYRNIDFHDLIQESYISIIKAIDSYDERREASFYTYAYYVVRSNLLNVLEDSSRFIRLPGDLFWLLKKYVSMCNEMETKLRRKPTREEIAKEMNLKIEKVKKLEKLVDNVMSIEEIDLIKLSYDPFNDDCELYHNITNKELSNKLNEIFNKLDLNSREIEMIKLRFGFYDRIYSLREIAEIYNIRHQRVSQIINRIIEKIILSECAEELLPFTEDYNYCNEYVKEYRNNHKRKRKVLVK